MGANRLRLRAGTPDADKEVERLALGMASSADSRPGDMRVAAGGDNKNGSALLTATGIVIAAHARRLGTVMTQAWSAREGAPRFALPHPLVS